jgi:hypothetical protein
MASIREVDSDFEHLIALITGFCGFDRLIDDAHVLLGLSDGIIGEAEFLLSSHRFHPEGRVHQVLLWLIEYWSDVSTSLKERVVIERHADQLYRLSLVSPAGFPPTS